MVTVKPSYIFTVPASGGQAQCGQRHKAVLRQLKNIDQLPLGKFPQKDNNNSELRWQSIHLQVHIISNLSL